MSLRDWREKPGLEEGVGYLCHTCVGFVYGMYGL